MRWIPFLVLLSVVALSLAACSDDASSPAAGSRDATTTDAAAADVAESADAVPDATPDAVAAFGSIAGNVFYNGAPLPDGVLSVGLVDANPPTVALRLEVLDGTTPPTTYRFEDVPAGTYHVLAFYDVGGDDTWDVPGDGDLVAVTQGAVGFDEDGALVENINVELR